MAKEEVRFVTEDLFLKERGQLDIIDELVLRQASQDGKYSVRVINLREMLVAMKEESPKEFADFSEKTAEQYGLVTLSFDELVDLAKKAGERITEFVEIVDSMILPQAHQIRSWRIEQRMTWRSLASAAFGEGWFEQWDPPSNQIMGMALAQKAAQLCNENYREEPWN